LTNCSGTRHLSFFFAVALLVAGNFSVRAEEASSSKGYVQNEPLSLSKSSHAAYQEMDQNSLLAVFPLENLSGNAAPTNEIRRQLLDHLKGRGLHILADEVLEGFMVRHRVRYTGGLSREIGQTLRGETGVKGVLIGSIELYQGAYPPKVGLALRLVSTGEKPIICWMDLASRGGNDTPGLLGLGLIRDDLVLLEKVIAKTVKSLDGYLSNSRGKDEKDGSRIPMEGRFRPKKFFRSRFFAASVAERPPQVAVLPFFNDSSRRHAGEIVRLHLLGVLVRQGNSLVLDPGEIRVALLKSRTIMEGGPSLPQGDLLLYMTETDLIFYGSVKEYQEGMGPRGVAEINFSCQILDPKSKRVIWSSISYNKGDGGVFFFDVGRVNTVPAMLSQMIEKLITQIFGPSLKVSVAKSSRDSFAK